MDRSCGCLDAAALLQFDAAIDQAGIAVIHTNDAIARLAAAIRQGKKAIKLPDAIIGATAQVEGRMIVTRNPKDFGGGCILRIPYDCQWDPVTRTANVSNVRPVPA